MNDVLTPDDSKRARRELGMSQQQVARNLGQTRTNVSWFESGRFKPEAEFVRQLRDFYEAQGVAFDDTEADPEAMTDDAPEDEQAGDEPPKAAKAPEGSDKPAAASHGFRQGLRISPELSKPQVDALFQALEFQEEAVEDLAAVATGNGVRKAWLSDELVISGDEDDSTEDEATINRELRERLAIIGMLRSALQGFTPVPIASQELIQEPWQAKNHGELVAAQIGALVFNRLDRAEERRVREALEQDDEAAA